MTKKHRKPTIVISVNGGCVDAVYVQGGQIHCVLADRDNYKAGGELCQLMPTERLKDADDLILEDPLVKK